MDKTTGIALTFPGQGSQVVGMGRDFTAAYSEARETFEEANDLLGFDLSALCFHGPEDELDDTINTQPAVYVCSIAILRVLQQKLPQLEPLCVAGHSLGEFSALTASGALSFSDGVRLVRERGRLMKQAGEKQPGAMAALLGMAREAVQMICHEASNVTGAPVVLANDNCPGQIVISGDTRALQTALDLASSRGARKVMRLAVSIAAHSPLMADASVAFQAALDHTNFQRPQMPVYSNATAKAFADVEDIRRTLGAQLTSPVRWTESMQALIACGATRFIEVGPGDVLTGLIKRLDRSIDRDAINTVDALDALVESFYSD